MCRQFFTIYEWCHCEEDSGHELCAARRRDMCPGTSIETVHMQCFCNQHASKGFKSEKKAQKPSGSSIDEKQSFTPRRKWYQICGGRSRTY
ncbi:hypothetical protein BDV26DRAFT_285313 [Aspergillus bertholletiae]|uniref:Uncharacterized protein n=1 Tax=Aspergillus bertholletiae TaxID=1226010 RepID=A0A5N7AWP5_9EURO|nr:hypothetical protein BDV26DRAFT_285313 [Aspergillus bertholletiae]